MLTALQETAARLSEGWCPECSGPFAHPLTSTMDQRGIERRGYCFLRDTFYRLTAGRVLARTAEDVARHGWDGSAWNPDGPNWPRF